MSINLRPYQEKAIQELRASLSKNKRVILCSPTGAGKTTISAFMIREALNKNKRCLFLAHRTELLEQAADRFKSIDLQAGIIKGTKNNINPYLNIASVQSLKNRLTFLKEPDLILIDECHLSMANSYQKVLNHFPNSYVVGLTATPRRLDGKPLGDTYQSIVNPISITELTEQGYLVPARYFAAREKADVSGVHSLGGDFNNKELFDRFDKKKLYDGVVDNYMLHAPNTSFLCFCVNIEHSIKTCQAFKDAGIRVEHLDGDTPEARRKIVIKQFREGLIQGITNVGLFTEGLDVPHVTTAILNRATESESLYLQMIGRILRPYEGKKNAIVLDHGGNVADRHGFHDDERLWSLEGKKKKTKVSAFGVKLCPRCFAMLPVATSVCPTIDPVTGNACNYTWQVKQTEKSIVKSEDFVEITKTCTPLPSHLKKAWSAMSENELKEVAKIRGYKSSWVKVQLNLRKIYGNNKKA